MNPIVDIERAEMAKIDHEIPKFNVGDTVKVHQKIIEGTKERIQIFQGVVIAINNKGLGKSFTVRRISNDVGVERIFPLYSPRIAKIEIVRFGKVRRAKLYYLRDKIGKAGRIKEKRRNLNENSKKPAMKVAQSTEASVQSQPEEASSQVSDATSSDKQ